MSCEVVVLRQVGTEGSSSFLRMRSGSTFGLDKTVASRRTVFGASSKPSQSCIDPRAIQTRRSFSKLNWLRLVCQYSISVTNARVHTISAKFMYQLGEIATKMTT